MTTNKLLRIDGVLWKVWTGLNSIRYATPICAIHKMRMNSKQVMYERADYSPYLRCDDCEKMHRLPRSIEDERVYVINKLDSKAYQSMEILNIDDESIPLAKSTDKSRESGYWVEAKLVESKSGVRLVVYAGHKEMSDKVQLFIEPNRQRLSFDQTNRDPMEVFTALEATFAKASVIMQNHSLKPKVRSKSK